MVFSVLSCKSKVFLPRYRPDLVQSPPKSRASLLLQSLICAGIARRRSAKLIRINQPNLELSSQPLHHDFKTQRHACMLNSFLLIHPSMQTSSFILIANINLISHSLLYLRTAQQILPALMGALLIAFQLILLLTRQTVWSGGSVVAVQGEQWKGGYGEAGDIFDLLVCSSRFLWVLGKQKAVC